MLAFAQIEPLEVRFNVSMTLGLGDKTSHLTKPDALLGPPIGQTEVYI